MSFLTKEETLQLSILSQEGKDPTAMLSGPVLSIFLRTPINLDLSSILHPTAKVGSSFTSMAKSRLSTRNGAGRSVSQMFFCLPGRRAPSSGFTGLNSREGERNSVRKMESLEGNRLLQEPIGPMIVGSIEFRSQIVRWVKSQKQVGSGFNWEMKRGNVYFYSLRLSLCM